ncbi:stage V sporulation protein G [Desulfitobacterium sp. LBE]|uniref:Putative septation protein SpoVG n=1 Tax=bioreactor metagenome TaxID=1076179 RepID=A0A644UAW7_9ZZZZ|nr:MULTISPECIES: SpoVG family protein [Desulfitobacterium]MEA5022211.1 SpoVG family protein [Desulfitobacterium hafniense]TWH59542.1 stage V sporulation protein G [Desulfitobacterium sp. LBE]
MRKAQSAAQASQESTQTAAEQSLLMKVDVKIGSIRPEGNVRAYASINLNDCFAIRNVRIVDSTKGLFVAMPSYKAGNDYRDICFPVTKEFREQLNKAVIDAYHQALVQSQGPNQQKAAETATLDQAAEQSLGLRMG